MNGEQLYALYVIGQEHCNNCDCEAWEILNNDERRVWDYMALRLAEPPPNGPRPAVIR